MATFDDIKSYYVNILQRDPSDDEVNGWVSPVNSGALTIDQVRKAFIDSPEAQHVAGVVRLYQAAFDRVPDQGGLKAWVQSGQSLEQIAESFCNSEEFTNRYGTSPSREAFVTSLYYQVLGRAPDAGGLAAWTNSGQSFSEMLAGFGKSEEFQIKTTVAVKTYLDNCGQGTEDYSGKLIEYTPPPAPVGETFTLTVGKDILVGTANDDTFNADAYNPVTGAQATTLSPVDSLDGGEGSDTLNIGVVEGNNATLVGTVKYIETVNIDNTDAEFAAKHSTGAVDASRFQDVTEIWQISKAANVEKLASSTTAGFRDVAATAGADLSVKAADAANTVSIALDAVTGDDGSEDTVENQANLAVSGLKLSSVTVSGTLAQAVTETDADAASLLLAVEAGKDVQSVSINSNVDTLLTVGNAGGSTKNITTVDAVNSGGSITYFAANTVQSILTGSGADIVAINTTTVKDNAATTINETVSASLMTGAGNDQIIVATSGTGKTTIDAGLGDDKVDVFIRGDDVLTVNLGDGNDSFTSLAPIGAKDVIDAGAGTDTLLLSLVGSTNVGAFRNFDVLDTIGLGKTLDTNILVAKNQVSEFVASGDVGAGASLTNVGANIGLRVSGDMGTTNTLSLTQKIAGAMTIRVDADEVDEVPDAVVGNDVNAGVTATNATSVKAIFDTAFTDKLVDLAALDSINTVDLSITADAATSLEIESVGAESVNRMMFNHSEKLTSATAYGSQDLTLDFDFTAVADAATNKLASVDASEMTGSLTFSLDYLADKGSVTLGSGADKITVTDASTTAGIESIVGFEKTAAVAVSVIPSDEAASTAAITDADILQLGDFDVAADQDITDGTIENGVLTFTGSGPSTLDAAIDIAGEVTGAMLFEYLGDSYVFGNDDTDTVVRLVDVVGVTHFAENGTTNSFFIV